MADTQDIEKQAAEFAATVAALREQVHRVIVGHEPVVDQTLVALLAGGHVLLEGVPGLGKTLLVRTLADALDLQFSRIQFTPDLMPADITGTNIVAETDGRRQFEFAPGPIFGNLLLADEINRATPKTQSAVLEAMQEQAVTVARQRHPLAAPFMVLATQNPLEMEGTYPLPEAQLDRFAFKVLLEGPGEDELVAILDRTTGSHAPAPEKVADGGRIEAMKALARQVPAAEEVTRYAGRLVLATHPASEAAPESVRRYVRYGASPRAAQTILLSAKVAALADGRFNVSFADLRRYAAPAIRHRVILNFDGQAEGIQPDQIVADVLDAVPETPQ
jgi:MoxR-like ATPase